ncbi:MAG: ABC transporter substrate-binding protein [Candidatus Melainabacteria bacterium]|nr:ABC transporter substrate-binding protein [Candidatus Melainabacteria bacterium]
MIKSFCVLFAGILILTGCSPAPIDQAKVEDPTTSKKASSAVPITIAQYGHIFLYMPLYVAQRKDFFKKHGLDVKLVSTGGDEKTFTAVVTGNAQFGVSDPTFVAIAREHGQSGKVVAAVVRGVPFWIVALKKDIGVFTKPEDFEGHRCAAFTAPSTSYAVMKKILADGKTKKASIVQGAFGTLPALLKSDQVDLALELEPTVSILVGEGAHVVYSPKDELGDFAFTGLEVSDKFAAEHPDLIKACVAALKDAMDYIHQDFDGAVEVAKQEFPEVKPEIVKDALARLRDSGTIPKSPMLPKSAWDKAISMRRDLGDLDSAGTYEENVDMSYLDMIYLDKPAGTAETSGDKTRSTDPGSETKSTSSPDNQ